MFILLKRVTLENSLGVLTVVLRSQNVSLGSDVVFSCGTNDSSLDIIWFFSSNIAASFLNEQLVEGGSVSKYDSYSRGLYKLLKMYHLVLILFFPVILMIAV